MTDEHYELAADVKGVEIDLGEDITKRELSEYSNIERLKWLFNYIQ